MALPPAGSAAAPGPPTAPRGAGPAAERAELAETRAQLREAQQTVEAIRDGEIDSLVIGPPGHEQVYSLASADRPYRLIVEAMNEGAATISPDGAILNANPRLAAMTGLEVTDLIGRGVLELIPDADRARFARLIEIGAGDSARAEMDLTAQDGRTVPVLLAVSGFDLDGLLVRCLVLTDRTAQRAAERQAASAHEALRESEERFRALFANAPVGIVEWTLSGELIRANPSFCQLTGYTADELRSRSAADISHPDDLGADTAALHDLVSGNIDTYRIGQRYLRKDGGVVWTELTRAMVRDPDGRPVVCVGIVRDITAQRAAEAEVRELNAGLEDRVAQRTADLAQSNTNLQAFTYSVSHDLRTPLRGMNGFSAALLEDYGDRLDGTGREYARRIQAAADQMGRIIDDLLHLAEVSRADLSLESLDLSSEVTTIAGDLQAREPGRRVRFGIEAGVWVIADRALIRTLVRELIENAWKFTARRGRAAIEFGTTIIDEAGICCYVRDNGIGFDPAYGHKLFQPFQRLHAGSEYVGTGIGLASVRRISERHGRRAWAEGTIDGGATFYFTLDAADPP
jgi:PAS domain S-box-containing protein